jgi:starch phosphorylase
MSKINKDSLHDAIIWHIKHSIVRMDWKAASNHEQFVAVALAVRDRLIHIAIETEKRYRKAEARRTFYLSMEFLMGRALRNNLANLGLTAECAAALKILGTDLDNLLNEEEDAALGNGGLGRLAACFLDSLATLGMPGYGYGINYEYGLFRQEICNGQQVEKPDNWLKHGTPWEVQRSDEEYVIPLYGRVDNSQDSNGNYRPRWVDQRTVLGVPNDMPIAGYGGNTVNILRLFTARASEDFDMQVFNAGEYIQAVERKVYSETISKVLYPSDEPAIGSELRLIQEYFLVACSLRDIFRKIAGDDIKKFKKTVVLQLNDTHPALTVAELMRMLVDDHELPWEEAWEITTGALAYTNHTLLPEALEKWPVSLLGRVLPRHLEIIYEINHRFLKKIESVWPGDVERMQRMSLIEESADPQIRMAHLAIVGSQSVNGVAAVHSELVKTELVPDFFELWPEKFNNKTNGVTPRRWLHSANPKLSELITESIGDSWVTDLDELRGLEKFADDGAFQDQFLAAKNSNKENVAALVLKITEHVIDPASLFDVQMKRFHEYKRQLLNVLHIVHAYLKITEQGEKPIVPRTFIFSGKAAPSYVRAKQIIELIHAIGDVINNDPRSRDFLKVVFVPNYSVSVAEVIIPATDLSEQISTAGFEASGTGNMKFAMNGALTIGTLDGANIEIAEEVGDDNIFIFGKTVEEIKALRAEERHPREFYEGSDSIKAILDTFQTDIFSKGDSGRFSWVYTSLVESWDPYFHLADLESYIDAQAQVDKLHADKKMWTRKAILNVARMGKFSSDRTIREYAKDIWRITPVL